MRREDRWIDYGQKSTLTSIHFTILIAQIGEGIRQGL